MLESGWVSQAAADYDPVKEAESIGKWLVLANVRSSSHRSNPHLSLRHFVLDVGFPLFISIRPFVDGLPETRGPCEAGGGGALSRASVS
jgi:hypothetical protein